MILATTLPPPAGRGRGQCRLGRAQQPVSGLLIRLLEGDDLGQPGSAGRPGGGERTGAEGHLVGPPESIRARRVGGKDLRVPAGIPAEGCPAECPDRREYELAGPADRAGAAGRERAAGTAGGGLPIHGGGSGHLVSRDPVAGGRRECHGDLIADGETVGGDGGERHQTVTTGV